MTTVSEIKVPDFINNTTFQKCLIKDLGVNEIEVVDTKISPATKPGDHYSSKMYRAVVTYRDNNTNSAKTANFVIKCELSFPDPKLAEEISKFGDMEMEVKMYEEVLPELNEIIENTQFSPKCYDIVLNPNRNYIFEDLCARGYQLGNRIAGLDEAHMAVALRKIGQFHAASMELIKRYPYIQDKFKGSFFTEYAANHEIIHRVWAKNIEFGAELVTNMPGYERFAEKLMKIYNNFAEFTLKASAYYPDKSLKVVDHGDLWVNNFLIKYDEETKKPADVIFVDYQKSFVNSPAIDINYLFASSATVDVLKRKLELIEKYYYPALVETLGQCKFSNIPSLDDIKEEIRDREMYTLLMMFGVLPIAAVDEQESKTSDTDQFLDDNKSLTKRVAGMCNRRFVETMSYLLVDLESILDETISAY